MRPSEVLSPGQEGDNCVSGRCAAGSMTGDREWSPLDFFCSFSHLFSGK